MQVTHKHLSLPRPLFLGDPGSGGFREMQAQDPTPETGSGEERLKPQNHATLGLNPYSAAHRLSEPGQATLRL